jgi:hypothetical protein
MGMELAKKNDVRGAVEFQLNLEESNNNFKENDGELYKQLLEENIRLNS